MGERKVENATWSYLNPLPTGPHVKGYLALYWHLMDAWYEEDEQVYAHARDPYKRVDILPSSRHVRIVLGELVPKPITPWSELRELIVFVDAPDEAEKHTESSLVRSRQYSHFVVVSGNDAILTWLSSNLWRTVSFLGYMMPSTVRIHAGDLVSS